jgi:hypothetical protein
MGLIQSIDTIVFRDVTAGDSTNGVLVQITTILSFLIANKI